jgi:hypothetical protein
MSDNGHMNDEAKEKGLDALEAALASADPAEAPDIAEELAAEMSDTLDETAKPNDAAKERPS